jgi:tetratricopeptide (TPR) repeat protein
MHVEFIDNFETLVSLKGNWDAVYRADPEAQYFLSSTWITNWFDKVDCRWVVLAARAKPGSRYVAFFPLQVWTEMSDDGAFLNEIKMGGAWLAGYSGFICEPEFAEPAIRLFAKCVAGLNWASLNLRNFAASPRRLQLFMQAFARPELAVESLEHIDQRNVNFRLYPCVRLPADWNIYLGTLSPKARQKARRSLKMIDESGEFRVTHADSDTIERDLNVALGFWRDKWAPKMAEDLLRAYLVNYRKMAKRCFNAGSLLLPVLWKGGTPIAAAARLVDPEKRSLICLFSGRDLTFKGLSPGFIINVYGIRWAIRNGFETYDFQMGNHPYKYEFGAHDREVQCLRIRTKSGHNLGDRLDPGSVPEALKMSKELHDAGKTALAARGYRQILEVDPLHQAALSSLGQIELTKALQLHQRGDLVEAERIYREILETNPSHFDAAHLLGVIFLQRGQFEAAERQISLAIEIKPGIASAYNNRGNALRRLKRLNDALANYDQAIALKPDYRLAMNNRADVLKDLKLA